MKIQLKIGDLLVYLFMALLVAGSFLGLHWMKSEAELSQVVVELDGKVIDRFIITEEMKTREVRIDAGEGKYNILRLSAEGAQIVEANCPDQICVRWGTIHIPGQAIVCLPHRVVVKIEGKKGEEPPVDVITS